MVFQFTEDAERRYKGFNPQQVGEALEQIRQTKGAARIQDLLGPEVVDAARPVNSPLHTLFLWDDKEAGERYRWAQARALTKAVVKVSAAPAPVAETAFARPSTPGVSAFRAVRAKQVDRASEARKDLLEWRRKYADLEQPDLQSVFEVIDEVLPALKTKAS